MALVSRNYQLIVSDVNFDGKLDPIKYSKIIIEILKFAIYSRGQIPLQYDLWRRDLLSERKKECASSTLRNSRRKSEETVKNIGLWFQDITELFKNYSDLQEILLLIGATYVSPKITYKMKLPVNLWLKNSDFSNELCNIQVLTELLKIESEISTNGISPTNIYLFIKMKNNCGINSFIPKPDFKPLPRGICIDINFKEKQKLLLKSHFEVFNESIVNSFNLVEPNEIQLKDNCDYMWFQSSIVVKGIRN